MIQQRVWSNALVVMAFTLLTTLATSCTLEDQAEPHARGAQVYAEYCVRCHGEDGAGGGVGASAVPDIRPRAIWSDTSDTLLVILAFGMATQYSADSVVRTMPPAPYTNADLAAVAAYISKHLGGVDRSFTAADVQRAKDAHKQALNGRLQNGRLQQVSEGTQP